MYYLVEVLRVSTISVEAPTRKAALKRAAKEVNMMSEEEIHNLFEEGELFMGEVSEDCRKSSENISVIVDGQFREEIVSRLAMNELPYSIGDEEQIIISSDDYSAFMEIVERDFAEATVAAHQILLFDNTGKEETDTA